MPIYNYINTSGQQAQYTANSSNDAIANAPNRANDSGVQLYTPPTISLPEVQTGGGQVTPPPQTTTPPPTPDSLGTLVNTAQGQADASTTQQTTEQNTYANLLGQLGQQTPDTQALENTQGVPQMQNDLQDLQKTANQQQAQYLSNYNTALARRSVGTIKNAEEAQITRQNAVDTMFTNSLISAKQGQLTTAQNLVSRAIALKYDPIKAKIEAQKFVLDQINTKASEDRKNALNLQLKQIEDVTSIQNESIKTLLSNGAPQDVIQNVMKANTKSEVLKAGGQYLATSNAEFQKVGDTLYRIDKNTGKVLNTYGTPLTNSIGTPIVVTRTVDTPTGKVPVDTYSLIKGDDPYLVAQKLGTDMTTLQKLNPKITDWNNLQIGASINIPSKDVGSGAITAVAGIPLINFNYLTQGTSALARMGAADRAKVMAESDAFLKKNNLDYSTFQSRYKAYNKSLGDNIERANNTQIFGGEVSGTVDQFVEDIGNDFSNLKVKNLTDLWAGKQVNDPTVQKYAFDLQTMRNDLAGYYAASRGADSPDDSDLQAAANVISNGISLGSASAFKDSINTNEQKVTGVINRAVDIANKNIWNLFGVGDKYQSQKVKIDPLENIKNYGNTHPEQQSKLTQMKLDGISVEDINNWINQQ